MVNINEIMEYLAVSDLKLGDHIAKVVDYKKTKYDGPSLENQVVHHGIIVSVNPIMVVHFNTTDNSFNKKKAKIIHTDLHIFRDNKRFIFRVYDDKSIDVKDTVNLCLQFLEEGYNEYNLLTNNCEHFVFHCKTGEKRSKQVEGFCRLGDKNKGFLRGIYRYDVIDSTIL